MDIFTSLRHYYSSLLSTLLPFFLAGWLNQTLPVWHSNNRTEGNRSMKKCFCTKSCDTAFYIETIVHWWKCPYISCQLHIWIVFSQSYVCWTEEESNIQCHLPSLCVTYVVSVGWRGYFGGDGSKGLDWARENKVVDSQHGAGLVEVYILAQRATTTS